MSNILLGVGGSIAAYRAADLARVFVKDGHTVRVCLTRSAAEFVTPALFEGLTGQPCLVGTFEEPVPGEMAHIEWARWADVVLIAPATANLLNALAAGLASDMLTSLALATHAPLVVAPAMNPSMLAHEATQASLGVFQDRGHIIVPPQSGLVACGEEGDGKLADNAVIAAAVYELTVHAQDWSGKRVLITSGPTQEPIDSVRYISNRSSGRMGAALARALQRRGAEVIVVSGPVNVSYPAGIELIRVKTAQQMLGSCKEKVADSDWVFGVAAVADFHVAQPSDGKIRRKNADLNLTLIPNPDIIGTLALENKGKKIVAFAAEPDDGLDYARAKIAKKGVTAIAVNNISRADIGFESDQNELTLVTQTESLASGLKRKMGCANWLLDLLAELDNSGRL